MMLVRLTQSGCYHHSNAVATPALYKCSVLLTVMIGILLVTSFEITHQSTASVYVCCENQFENEHENDFQCIVWLKTLLRSLRKGPERHSTDRCLFSRPSPGNVHWSMKTSRMGRWLHFGRLISSTTMQCHGPSKSSHDCVTRFSKTMEKKDNFGRNVADS